LRHGSVHDCLHRRHLGDGGVLRSSEESPRGTNTLIDRPRIYNQHNQVNHHPNSTDRVPGAAGGLHHSTLESSGQEDAPPQNGGESEPAKTTDNSMTAGTANQETAGSLTSNSPSSSLLLVSTRRPSESPEPQQPGLQYSAITVTISLGELTWWLERLAQ